jgi:hypothetical protein
MPKKQPNDYAKDISEIRTMMEKAAVFKPLMGLSGIFAGMYALAGAYLVTWVFAFQPESASGDLAQLDFSVLLTAIVVLVAAVGTILYFSWRKANQSKAPLWTTGSRQLVLHTGIPLLTGGVFVLLLMQHGLTGLLAPTTLVFYGLALVNAARYSYNELRAFGLFEITLGLAGIAFPAYGVLLWAVGFGFLHIVYGFIMHFRYDQ